MAEPVLKMEKEEPVTLEYYKAPFGKRIFAFLLDALLMSFLSLGFFVAARAVLENSSAYQDAFATYLKVSKDSGLYTYEETNDNLVIITSYYSGETYAQQNEKEETALLAFYGNAEFFPATSSPSGSTLYAAEKIGDTRIGKADNLDYFVYNSKSEIVANPTYSDEKMHDFYVTAVENALQYLNNVEGYVNATKTLSLSINFIIIPCALVLAFSLVELVIPLLFFRRGYQTLGLKAFNLSLVNGYAVSPPFKSFFIRFLWMLFAELLLSLVTFGVPLIVSFSMMSFRKDGQAFHDYMSGLYLVDSSEQSIYRSKSERDALLKKAQATEARTDLIYEEEQEKTKNS